MREITYSQASLEALQEEFRRDKNTVYLSTDIPFALRQEFGEARIRATPLSESAFVGAAIGLAGSGFRPVVDIGLATFGFVAMDQIVNQAAKITYMLGGQARFPIVYRMRVGGWNIWGSPALDKPVFHVYECSRTEDYPALLPL